jgi:dethiobiotin synthetase
MSPLGERFTLAEIVREIPGRLCVVASNALGVINAMLLTHRALESADARYVLMNSREPDASARSNADVIREWTQAPVYEFPFLANPDQPDLAAEAVLDSLLNWWLDAK